MTVSQTIAEPMEHKIISKRRDQRQVLELMETVGLAERY